MKILKSLFAAFILILGIQQGFAQGSKTEALHQKIKAETAPRKKFDLLTQLISYYMASGDVDSMANLNKQALHIAQALHNDTLLVQSYLNIGNYLVFKSDFEASLEFYFKALHLAEERKLNKFMVTILNNIGGEYEDLNNFGEAIKYTRRSAKVMAEVEDKGVMPIYNNWHMAFDNYNLGKPDSALLYLPVAQKLNLDPKGRIRDPYIQAHIYWVYGLAYDQLKNKELARQWYTKAVNYSDTVKLATPLCLSLNSYSDFLYNNGEYRQARELATKALKEALRTSFLIEVIKSASVLSKVYNKLNMPDSSNHYYQLKDTYQERVFNQQRISRLQDMTFTEQIRQQEEQARLLELEEQRKHNLQYAGIAIAIISFIVVFLLVSRSSIANPRVIEFLGVVGLLILFEFVNLLLHPVIGHYTHESPLLMLFFMVCIAALLVPLHHKIEKWMKQKLVKQKVMITAPEEE